MMNCSKCGNREMVRSRRRKKWEFAIAMLLSLYPFRCTRCQWRTFKFSLKEKKAR